MDMSHVTLNHTGLQVSKPACNRAKTKKRSLLKSRIPKVLLAALISKNMDKLYFTVHGKPE